MIARTIQWEWQLLLGTEETSFLVACPYLLVGNWLEYVGITRLLRFLSALFLEIHYFVGKIQVFCCITEVSC